MPPEIPADEDSNALFMGEEDQDSENEIPARPPKGKDVAMADADEEEDGDEEEYVVEKIMEHKGKGKKYHYLVKWQGYEDAADMTWEPEANLDNAKELVARYWTTIPGGRPGAQGDSKKRKISQAAVSTPTSAKAEKSTKRARNSNIAPKKEESPEEFDEVDSTTAIPERQMPKLKDNPAAWESIIDHVETIEQVKNDKDNSLVNMVKVTFCDGLSPWKSAIPLERMRKGAPQKLLDYMIAHLSFRSGSNEPEGDYNVYEPEPEETKNGIL